ncbi:putative pectinesterase/pectinesterase inhibitor 12 [Quercus suber]|uniref:Pectinesterase/pectinesterase inhibitor 12 n=1 Tax=Quercus suber TaxID=58331 RepID=A0AAW0L196_QUESU
MTRSLNVELTAALFLIHRWNVFSQVIHIENKAGVEKQQAIALRVNADFVALYKCSIIGYKNTLYVHSFCQFYQECDTWGTIDFIFGNAGVVFQACTHNLTIAQMSTLESPSKIVQLLLLQMIWTIILPMPQRMYSRTVYLESYIGDFIVPARWRQWSDDDDDDQGLDTLYYG